MGYTNFTAAGILKYNIKDKKIVWKHKRKFEGPQLDCKIYLYENKLFWVKNSTELICLDMHGGSEIFNFRTIPRLYSKLCFFKNDIIFGTSGADGFINDISVNDGKLKWSVPLKNGCVYFDFFEDSVIVGDFSKSIQRISIDTGSVIDRIFCGGEVVGDIKVYGNNIYTVIWGNTEKNIRIVNFKI